MVTHNCRWRAANSDLCLAPMAIEQWGFFSVPHLLRHGASVYNGHLRGSVTLTFSSGAVTICFYDLGLLRLKFEHPTFRLRGERSNPLRHRRGDSDWVLASQYYKMGHRLKHDWLLYALYMYLIFSLTSFKTLLHVMYMYM